MVRVRSSSEMTFAMRGSTGGEELGALWASNAEGPARAIAANPRQARRRRSKSQGGGQGANIQTDASIPVECHPIHPTGTHAVVRCTHYDSSVDGDRAW